MWENIETDFGGDETTMFGPRKETGSGLYQVETLGRIFPTEQNEVTSYPHVVSAVLGSFACIAVDKLLAVFDDFKITDTFMFDYTVDVLEWSPDGKFLMVGGCNGRLYILNSSNLQMLLSKPVVPKSQITDGQAFKKIIFHNRENDLNDLFCLTAGGQLIVIESMDLIPNVTGFGNLAKSIFNQVKMVDTSEYHTLTTTDVFFVEDKIITVGAGDFILAVWSSFGSEIELEDSVGEILENDAGVVSAKVTPDNQFFFLLDENHHLTLWSSITLTLVQQWTDMTISSFQIFDSSDNTASNMVDTDYLRLVLITEGEGDIFTLQVKSFPSYSTVYSLQLSSASVLSKCLPIQEVVYLAEFICDESSSQASAVRFKYLLETEPDTRLYRLIRKKKFQEAQEFARMFGLDVELVYKARLDVVLDELSPWNATKHDEERVAQLMSEMWDSIELITDDLHLIDTCVRAALPAYSDTYKLQTWCRSLLETVGSKKNRHEIEERYQDLMTQFCSIQNRFCTYRMAYGSENYSAADWDLFMRANLMKESCRALQDGDMVVAFTLWRRHQEEWIKHMNIDVIENIVVSIPDKLTIHDVYGWLKDDLIPYVSRVVPLALTHVLTWAINKAVNMESFQKEDWPQNALKFLKSIDSCICEETNISVTESTHSHYDCVAKSTVNISTAMKSLHDTLTSLQNLHDLKHKYKHNLTLKQLQQETTESVAFRMLDRVSFVEQLPDVLKNQVRPYITQHKLNENEIFSRYASDLLGRKASAIGRKAVPKSYRGSSLSESKLIAVIGYIKDPKEKVSAIIDIVRMTPLPLSSEIENLIQAGLEMQHPLVTKLKEHCQRLDIRILIFKYSPRSQYFPVKERAMELIYFIVRQDTPECVEDALKAMGAYNMDCQVEIYTFRARFLISTNRVEEYLNMLKTIPPQMRIKCGRHMIYAQPEVHQPADESDQEALELKKRFIYAAVETGRVIDSLVQDMFEQEELRTDCKDLKRVLTLLTEYDMLVTLTEYRDLKSRECLLYSYVEKAFSKPQNETHFGKLYRLADLLQISQVRLHSELAIFTARTGHIAAAVKYSRKITEYGISEDTVSALYDVGVCFLQVLRNVDDIEPKERCHLDDLIHATYELACQTTIYAKGPDLLRCLELSRAASLAVDVSRQCENKHSHMEQTDVLMKYDTLEPMFKEDALVMSTEDVIPLVTEYLCLHPSFSNDDAEEEKNDEDDTFELKEFCTQSTTVITHHMNNNHLELAFQFLAHTLLSVTDHIFKYSMSFSDQPQMKTKLDRMNKELENLVEGAKPCEEKLISELFLKSLDSSKVDHKHALLCITSLPPKVAKKMLLKTINSCTSQHNYKKLKAVLLVGLALGEMHKDADLIVNCKTLQPQARWGYRLRNLKIDFGYALSPSRALKILAQIASYDIVDVSVVKEFCRDFALEEKDGMGVYLEEVVAHGCKHDKVRNAIRQIKDDDSLLRKLSQLLKECNPYDYDKIHFLLCELQQLPDPPVVQKGLNVLKYIKLYTRRSPPSAYEKKYLEDECKKESDLSMSFTCSTNESKLPYHPLVSGDAWEIISPELHFDSLQIWISLANELEIKKDNIYTGTVKNMVYEYVKAQHVLQTGSDKKNHCNWNMTSSSVDFLKDIQELLLKVTNIRIALACTQFVIKELPTGAEKIQALKEGTALAEKWYLLCENNSNEKENAQRAFTKFSSILKQLSTQRVLHLHNLAEPEFLSLDRSPRELIIKLFDQPGIMEQGWRNQMSDAYEIAKEIAEIQGLNLQEFVSSLVEKWLPTIESQDEGDTTMTFDLSNFNKSEQPTFADDENLKRVLYMMKKGPLETNVIYLLTIIFPEEKSLMKKCNLSQLQALYCLLKLCDNDMLVEICNKTVAELRHLMCVMGYLVELEKLHFVYSVNKFEECNKESLVKGIWRNHSHKTNAVLLVTSLCLDYNIHLPLFWEQLLKQFLSLGLVDHLETLLIRLCSVHVTWTVPSFVKAWQACLNNALNKYCTPLTEHQLEMCVHYVNLLHRCPVLLSLDMKSLAEQYKNLDLSVCAACCLVLQGNQHAKEYLDGDKLQYLQQLDYLITIGLNAAIAKEVQAELFDLIDDEGKYAVITCSSYKDSFAKHVIKCNRIHNLLQFAVKHNRLQAAENLVKMYCSYYESFGEELSQWMESQNCHSYLEPYDELSQWMESQNSHSYLEAFLQLRE